MINVLNLATTALGFLANILIIRSTGDLHTLDRFYGLLQIALAISGFFSATIMYNLVPKLIASASFLRQIRVVADYFYSVTIVAVAASLICAGFGVEEPMVAALVLILLGLSIDGAIWQSLNMLRRAVGFQLLPQMCVVIIIVVLHLPVIVEYTIALFLAYTGSRIVMVRKFRRLGRATYPKLELSFMVMLRNSMFAGIGSFVFGAYPFLDVYFSTKMNEGSLTLLVVAQRVLISSANILIYSRFLKSPHEFQENKSFPSALALIYRNILLNTGTFFIILLSVWASFELILSAFNITDHAERFRYTIFEMLPGIYFMMQSVFLLRYIKSFNHRLLFDVAMICTWITSYVAAFYLFGRHLHTLAFCYSVAWAITTLCVILPTVIVKLKGGKSAP